MTPVYVNALQAVLNRFDQTYYDEDMHRAIERVRYTGRILIPTVTLPHEYHMNNPEFYSALVPYVNAVYDVLRRFERTFYDVDMIRRIYLARIAGNALFSPASRITRYEDENEDNYGYWTEPYNNYIPYDTRYKKAIKYVFEKFESTFYDEIMNRLIRILKASE